MDIHSKKPYPSSTLSNFAHHEFWFKEIKIAGMEGFLQSLKFKNPEMQKEIMKRTGKWAKDSGKGKNWQQTQTLWWQGEPIKRESDEYQQLIDEAYEAMFSQNERARAALIATKNEPLTHEDGWHKKKDTILTKQEFTSELMRVRQLIYEDKLPLVRMDSEGKPIQEGSRRPGKERF